MRYLSLCSGIEAASNAWKPLGWEAVGFSEIEPFPCAVLAERFPEIPNYGDMTKYKEWKDVGQFDVLVGGTPCQSFSVAGLRRGLEDPRGNLMLTYGAIANHFKPRVIVWENVPGVLSSNGGRDFGTFLGMLAECGYGFAYRILDAQYFGVPQRRRRVFVVGYIGDWRRAAQILFESESLRGDNPPSRKTGEGVAKCLTRGASQRYDSETETMIATTLTSNGDAHSGFRDEKGLVYDMRGRGNGNTAPTLCTDHPSRPSDYCPVVMGLDCFNGMETGRISATIGANSGQSANHSGPQISVNSAVRRLTPVECERLQGFPDNWTRIPWRGASAEDCPDGPRYKAIGNSMAVSVMRWIGERIEKYAKEV